VNTTISVPSISWTAGSGRGHLRSLADLYECPRCGVPQPAGDFSHHNRIGAAVGYCKNCVSSITTDWRRKRPPVNSSRLALRRKRAAEGIYVCPSCGCEKRSEDFHQHNKAGQPNTRCKACSREAAHERLGPNARRFGSPPEGSWAWKYSKTTGMRRRGQIGTGACAVCGTSEVLREHHPDYRKPAETITVCQACHGDLHAIARRLPGFSHSEIIDLLRRAGRKAAPQATPTAQAM